jgi:hypothetical protein
MAYMKDSAGRRLDSIAISSSDEVTADRLASELCARMTVRPTRARRTLVRNLYQSLQATGILSKLDAFYVFAAHHVQAAQLNWIGCAQDAIAVNAPTFQVDRGFTGNGTSAYLDTSTPANTLELFAANAATMGVYVRQVLSGSIHIDLSAGGASYINPNSTGNVVLRANTSSGSAVSVSNGGNATGLFAWTRDATTAYVYRAGSQLGTGGVATGALASTNVMFFRDASGASYSGRQLAAGFIGGSLSPADHANLNTALLSYLTAIGAN